LEHTSINKNCEEYERRYLPKLASFGFSSISSLGSSQVRTPDCKVLHSKAKSELASLESEAKLELKSSALISPILGF
jgi:hypothetical protein